MIIWVSHAWSWYWYVHAACGVLSCFKLEARIPLNYVLLCDCLEPIIDDFIRPECCKRQSNFYIAIRWDSAQWSLACLECHTSVCTLHCCQIFSFFTKCLLGESLVKLEIKNILSKIASHDGNLLTICLLQFSVVRVPTSVQRVKTGKVKTYSLHGQLPPIYLTKFLPLLYSKKLTI